MQLTFTYSRDKDIWCLLQKGKGSQNSNMPTKVYTALTAEYGDEPTKESISRFIDSYLLEHGTDTETCIQQYTEEWSAVQASFHKRAEQIFGVTLPHNITAYLTINNRCPYSIEEHLFFVTFPTRTVRKTIMHELWHFYTWYAFGNDEVRLGKAAYNDCKEALTVRINIECVDLLPEGVRDTGYPQHQELRNIIEKIWREDKNMQNLWNQITR